MNRLGIRNTKKWLASVMSLAVVTMPLAAFAQTKISYHGNKFQPTDDVKLGRQAATEAEPQFPLLGDSEVNAYVERVGQRLVSSIPTEFQHSEFRYYFKVINASDINAFALPGGPMYVSRGMIEAAHTEGEMAGVMAHELSHVALRHGTAQATKARSQGVGVYFLKFSREYETEADLLGARIMANAGYDPRDLANMFRTIEAQGGGGGGFLSDHPSPANRYARINQEAQYLRVQNEPRDDRQFSAIKERMRGYPTAQSMTEIQRSGRRQGDPTSQPTSQPTVSYDKFRDVTLVASRELKLRDEIPVFFWIRGIVAFNGDQTKLPDSAILVFDSHSIGTVFVGSHDLIFLADGSRIRLGNTTHDIDSIIGGVVHETMRIKIQFNIFEQIVRAENVEFMLGTKTFSLSESDLKELRRLLPQSAPQSDSQPLGATLAGYTALQAMNRHGQAKPVPESLDLSKHQMAKSLDLLYR